MRLNIFKYPLHLQILTALVAGLFFGYYFPDFTPYTNWVGVLFLRSLNMVVIPLIVCSIINGLISLGQSKSVGKLAAKTLLFFFITTFLAISTGFAAALIFKPGSHALLSPANGIEKVTNSQPSFGELFINVVPKNIFEALSEGQMLSIIFFSLVFGIFINKSQKKTRLILGNFFESVMEVVMKIVLVVMRLAPLGVFSIASGEVARQVTAGNNITGLLSSIGMLILVVIGALLFHGLINLSFLLNFVGRVSPIRHLKHMVTPLVTVFSTASTSATMPLTMEALEKNNGVSPKIIGFTIPLSASINLNGTALYESIIVIFIAQMYGISLSISQLVLVFFMSFLGAVGIGIPMAFLITIVVILKAAGLPAEGLAIILPIDRLLDMFRSTINMYSGSCVASLVSKSEGEVLKI